MAAELSPRLEMIIEPSGTWLIACSNCLRRLGGGDPHSRDGDMERTVHAAAAHRCAGDY